MKTIVLFLMSSIWMVAVSQNFDVYVSDAGNFQNPPWQILKFDEAGKNAKLFSNSNLNWPQDILFLEDRKQVLISNFGTGSIAVHDVNTGTFIRYFATGIAGPTRIKIGKDSLIYVLQWNGNGRVRRYTLDGFYLGEFTKTGVPQSIGLDWDKQGNLYVSSYTADIVRKYDPSGQDLGLFIQSDLIGPTNIWFDDIGDLLVLDYDGGSVKRFDAQGNYKGIFIFGLKNCEGVAIYPNGDILIGNGGTSAVKLYDSRGRFKGDLILSRAGNLITPNAVVLRARTTSSTFEKFRKDFLFLMPSIGTAFQLQTDPGQYPTMEIYNSIGNFVETIDLSSSSTWNASFYSEGLYIAVLKDKQGKLQSQTVIVKK